MKKLLSILILLLCVTVSHAANINIALTNWFGGTPYTNSGVRVVQISTNMLANGTAVQIGLPQRVTLSTNGTATLTNLLEGNYLLTNSSPYLAIAFQSPPGDDTYNLADVRLPGYNAFFFTGVRSVTATNGLSVNQTNGNVVIDGSGFTPTEAMITNALGFFPLSPTEVTNAITNAITTLSNSIVITGFQPASANLTNWSNLSTNFLTTLSNGFVLAIQGTNTALLAALATQSNNLVTAIQATNTALLSSQATLSNNVVSAAGTLSNNVFSSAFTLSNNFILRIATNGTTASNVFQTISAAATASNNLTSALIATNAVLAAGKQPTNINLTAWAQHSTNAYIATNSGAGFSNTLSTPSILGRMVFISPDGSFTNGGIEMHDDGDLSFEGGFSSVTINSKDIATVPDMELLFAAQGLSITNYITNNGAVLTNFINTKQGTNANLTAWQQHPTNDYASAQVVIVNANSNNTTNKLSGGFSSTGVLSLTNLNATNSLAGSFIASSGGTGSNTSFYGLTTFPSTSAFGFQAQNLTTSQRDAATPLVGGYFFYNTTTKTYQGYNVSQDVFLDFVVVSNGVLNVNGDLSANTNATVYSNLFVGGSGTFSNLTASRALVSDSAKGITNSAVSTTELNRLSGVTSGVQTNIDARLMATGGTATNSLTVKGTLSVVSNATFNTTVTTNGVTNLANTSTYGTNFATYISIGDLSPTGSGLISTIRSRGTNTDGVGKTFSSTLAYADTSNAGSENGRYEIQLLQAGATNVVFKANSNSVTLGTNTVVNGSIQFPYSGAVAGYVLTATGTNGATTFSPVSAGGVSFNTNQFTGTSSTTNIAYISLAPRDGTTDARATIQAELDAMTNGGTLYFLPGTYKLTNTINITNARVTIAGSGDATLFKAVGNYGDIFYAALGTDPTNYPAMEDIAFRRFAIESDTFRTNGAAIHMKYAHRPSISEVRIGLQQGMLATNNIFNGVFWDGQSEGSINHCNINFRNYGVHVKGRPIGAGWDFFTAYDGWIGGSTHLWGQKYVSNSACVYIDDDVGGFQIDAGNMSWADYGVLVGGTARELMINSCFLDDVGTDGLSVQGSLGVLTVRNSWMAACGQSVSGYGINLPTTISNVQVVGNYIYSNEGTGLRMQTPSQFVISGNYFFSNTSSDISLTNYAGTSGTISGNFISTIQTNDGTYANIVVSGNSGIDDSGRNFIANSTNTFVIDTLYTNGPNRAWVSASVNLDTGGGTGLAKCWLIAENLPKTNTVEIANDTSNVGYINPQITILVEPYRRFYFTNLSGAGASANIVTETCNKIDF